MSPESYETERTCKLKRLLVLILGCTAWGFYLFYNIFTSLSGASMLIWYIVQFAASYGAMILFHWLRKRIVPVILASAALLLTVLSPFFQSMLYGIRVFPWISLIWPNLLVSLLGAVLLLLYTILGKKSKDSIVWMIVYLGLFTATMVISFRIEIFSLILSLHVMMFFSAGYSPDKWYRRKQHPGAGKIPPPDAPSDI